MDELLLSVQKDSSDQVTELLESCLGPSEAWRNRLILFMHRADLSAGRQFFKLFVRLIDEGVFDNVFFQNTSDSSSIKSELWWFINDLPTKRPAWASEIIGHYLKRGLTLSSSKKQPNPFDYGSGSYPRGVQDDEHYKKILMETAAGAPAKFVDQVIPFMSALMKVITEHGCQIWRYRDYGESRGFEYTLLEATEIALCKLAAEKPISFIKRVKQYFRGGLEPLEYLLIRAYTSNGVNFADESIDYLCNQPTRLSIGYNGKPCLATRQLLEAVSPHCSDKQLMRLERMILGYYPNWERTYRSPRYRAGKPHCYQGLAQFLLLEGIELSRRSRRIACKIQILKWRFDRISQLITRPSRSVEGGFVVSPISDEVADQMTNEQWLLDIKKFDRNGISSERFERNGRYIGGATELSRVLETQVRKKPQRFAELIFHFPENAHQSYFEAILNGIIDTDLDLEVVLNVCVYCHKISGKPYGRQITKVLGSLAELQLPTEALDIIAWYATEDPDPEREIWRVKAYNENYYYGGDPLTAGINSVRGAAALAIARLIYHNSDRIPHFAETLKKMVQDPSIAVRSWVAYTLIFVLEYDAALAIDLFKKLIDTEDILLSTIYIKHFLEYGLQKEFDRLDPVLQRMINSQLSDVAKTGAMIACNASIFLREEYPLAIRCLSGTEIHREGAAEALAVNLQAARFQSFCENKLIELFNDPSEVVRSKASACFNYFKAGELGRYVKLISKFIQSAAFNSNKHTLVHALKNTAAKLPDLTYKVCKDFLDAIDPEPDSRTRFSLEMDAIASLVVRGYSQNVELPKQQTQYLDLIDRIVPMDIPKLDNILALYDNRELE